MAAKGMQFHWRLFSGTISTNLDVILEMSPETCSIKCWEDSAVGLYLGFDTVDELNWQYLPSKSGLDATPYNEGWPKQSAATREALDCRLSVPFGAALDEHLDIFPAKGEGTPVHMFIHGGYWRAYTAKEFSFVANLLVEQGIAVVVNTYSLCPKVTIDEIVRQNRAAIKWLMEHAGDFGGDPANITVSGHSAGGHLAAMAALTDWPGDYGVDANALRGIVAISGLYDLRPFRFTELQPHLQLTGEQIQRCSPLFQITDAMPPTWLVVGAKETPEFHRQSDAFAEAARAAGNTVERISVDGANHLTVMEGFNDPQSRLFRLICDLAMG